MLALVARLAHLSYKLFNPSKASPYVNQILVRCYEKHPMFLSDSMKLVDATSSCGQIASLILALQADSFVR